MLFWASALHVAAMVLLAAKFLDHLRYVLTPSRWPLMRSMVRTWIDEAYIRNRHPAWFAAINGDQTVKTATSDAAAAPVLPDASGATATGAQQ